mmetsp:Transcript_38776/g.90162  ORF Transcript_38776/g.90162 Transcript_38776/m.90162 type:complete len:149 (-) Transcript_38776:761-1207(-)
MADSRPRRVISGDDGREEEFDRLEDDAVVDFLCPCLEASPVVGLEDCEAERLSCGGGNWATERDSTCAVDARLCGMCFIEVCGDEGRGRGKGGWSCDTGRGGARDGLRGETWEGLTTLETGAGLEGTPTFAEGGEGPARAEWVELARC